MIGQTANRTRHAIVTLHQPTPPLGTRLASEGREQLGARPVWIRLCITGGKARLTPTTAPRMPDERHAIAEATTAGRHAIIEVVRREATTSVRSAMRSRR